MLVVFPLFSQHLFLLCQLKKWCSKKKKNEMLELVKNALIAATKFIQKNLPLYSILFKDITYLLPTVRNKDWTMCAIGRVSERFPRVMKEWDVSVIMDEWGFFTNKNRYQMNGIKILTPKILKSRLLLVQDFWQKKIFYTKSLFQSNQL